VGMCVRGFMPILWLRSLKSLNCCAYTKFRGSDVGMCMTTFMPILWLRSLKSLTIAHILNLEGWMWAYG
jgi:hypothetical protein